MTPSQKAWLKLLMLALGSGIAVGITSYAGGCKPIIATLTGIGTAATNVYHALSDSPKDTPIVPSPTNEGHLG